MQADGGVFCADAGARRRFGRCGVVEERRDEALDAETAQPPVMQRAGAPQRERCWPRRLLGFLCGVALVYVFSRVILPNDPQSGIALMFYSPLCVLPAAFFFARYENSWRGVALCAATTALGVIVGLASHMEWGAFVSPDERPITVVLLTVEYVAAFVLACFAALMGYLLGCFERRQPRHQPYCCPACGHFLLGVKGPTCPKCRRPFTIEELRAAAGDE